jgi:hypothetical protein
MAKECKVRLTVDEVPVLERVERIRELAYMLECEAQKLGSDCRNTPAHLTSEETDQ